MLKKRDKKARKDKLAKPAVSSSSSESESSSSDDEQQQPQTVSVVVDEPQK